MPDFQLGSGLIELVEYSLKLTTDENIEVSELDPGLFTFWNDEIENSLKETLDLCSNVTRQDVEDAKVGYDKILKTKLRNPIRSLLCLRNPVCSLIKVCQMADRKICTTKNSNLKGGKFPICWESSLDGESQLSNQVMNAIVHAWRQNRYVFFITK